MKYEALNADLFIQNRKAFAEQMKPNSIAIFHSNDEMPRNGDCTYVFRQDSDLFYLSGLDQEEVVLILCPNHPMGFDEIVFTKQTNDHIKVWDGYKYTQEDARRISGVKQVRWLDAFEGTLRQLLIDAEHVYVNTNENVRASDGVESRNMRKFAALREVFPAHKWERAQPIMKALRMIKSEVEIAALQHACNITDKAFRRVLATTKPGMNECEVEANIIYEFIRNRANGHAYTPIVAGGPNACILHYNDNNQILRNGDVLLMDFGAEYANYAADLSRSIPVNGRFTDRQKAVYNAVLRVKKEAEAMLVVGNNIKDYHKEVGLVMEKELIGLGLISEGDVRQQNPDYPAYKKYFMHGTSHHLGIDVHDLSNYGAKMTEGMVFTCEPGIYIPEEGLGIRIEDDILVTGNGPVNLMKNIPIEVEEIEELMNAGVTV